jgi:hypothetical protein
VPDLEPRFPPRVQTGRGNRYTRDELASALHRAAHLKGTRPLTTRDADAGRYGLPSARCYQTTFGSWRRALTAVGLTHDRRGGRRRAV